MLVKNLKLLTYRCKSEVVFQDFHTTNPFTIQWQRTEEFLTDLIYIVFPLVFHLMHVWLLVKRQPNNRYFRVCSGVQLHELVNLESGTGRPALQGAFEPWQQNIFSNALWSWSRIWWIVGQETGLLVMDLPLCLCHHESPKCLGHDFFIIKKGFTLWFLRSLPLIAIRWYWVCYVFTVDTNKRRS